MGVKVVLVVPNAYKRRCIKPSDGTTFQSQNWYQLVPNSYLNEMALPRTKTGIIKTVPLLILKSGTTLTR